MTKYLVNRLDKDTQGILLLAKNEQSLQFLQDQFRSRTVQKHYLAVVWGVFDRVVWISGFQTANSQNPIRQEFFWSRQKAVNYAKKEDYVRSSRSIFYPILHTTFADGNSLSLIKIKIYTGRTHQIRTQAESLGYPLLGDRIYPGNTKKLDLTSFTDPKNIPSFKDFQTDPEIFSGLYSFYSSCYSSIEIPNQDFKQITKDLFEIQDSVLDSQPSDQNPSEDLEEKVYTKSKNNSQVGEAKIKIEPKIELGFSSENFLSKRFLSMSGQMLLSNSIEFYSKPEIRLKIEKNSLTEILENVPRAKISSDINPQE